MNIKRRIKSIFWKARGQFLRAVIYATIATFIFIYFGAGKSDKVIEQVAAGIWGVVCIIWWIHVIWEIAIAIIFRSRRDYE